MSDANRTDRHFLPEISSLLTLLKSSVDLPANMGPMISSILPLYVICSGFLTFISGGVISFLGSGDSELAFLSELLLARLTLLLEKLLLLVLSMSMIDISLFLYFKIYESLNLIILARMEKQLKISIN